MTAIPQITVDCPQCGESRKMIVRAGLKDVEARTEGEYEIARCTACEFIYLSRRPEPSRLKDCYPDNYYTLLDSRQSPLKQKLYLPRYHFRRKRIEKTLKRIPASLLEVGYGDGRFLEHLRDTWGKDCALGGIDFKPPARTLGGVELMTGDFLNHDFKKKYEAIVLYDVLEHLPNPLQALNRLRHLLLPGGSLFIQVPNWNSLGRLVFKNHWSGLQIPRHQSFFSRKSFRQIFAQCGLEMTHCAMVFDPGDLSVSLCNWLTDRLRLKTPPRQSPLFTPLTLLCAPLALLQALILRNSGEMEVVGEATFSEI